MNQPDFKPVYILGAGASFKIGAPLVNNFLSKARVLRYSRGFPEELIQPFDNLFEYQGELYSTRRILGVDFNNLETLFSILDMDWQTSGAMDNGGPSVSGGIPWETKFERLEKTRRNFITLIIETLRRSIAPDLSSTYRQNVQFLGAPDNCSFITFNYDLAIERALSQDAGEKKYRKYVINYGDAELPPENSVTNRLLLKLHGSANWVYCDQCKFLAKFKGVHGQEFEYITPFEVVSNRGVLHKSNLTPCKPESANNVIVPPTWYKTNYLKVITKVWSVALNEIAQATHIFIIGYSFPKTDVFFEQLLSLGLRDSKNLKRIIIVNPGTDTQESLKQLFDRHFLANIIYINDYFENTRDYLQTPIGTEAAMNGFIDNWAKAKGVRL